MCANATRHEPRSYGTWLYDPSTGLTSSSEEVRRIFGAQPREAPEQYLFAHIHPGDRPRAEAEFKMAVETGKTFVTEFRILQSADTKWIRAKGRLLDNKRGPARLIGFVEDITARKDAEHWPT